MGGDGHLSAARVLPILKEPRPKPAWLGVKPNCFASSWEPKILNETSSASLLAFALDLKKAKWLKEAEPGIFPPWLHGLGCNHQTHGLGCNHQTQRGTLNEIVMICFCKHLDSVLTPFLVTSIAPFDCLILLAHTS